ncbi:collagen alpha-1(I) chain-like [Odocoileus virginianus]|uniref:Collagen alpha-1(I) chain-like n=1 Tax=Odocoileus virginianus TaxID=9874 RepID=A0ABM4IHC8_ODOVR
MCPKEKLQGTGAETLERSAPAGSLAQLGTAPSAAPPGESRQQRAPRARGGARPWGGGGASGPAANPGGRASRGPRLAGRAGGGAPLDSGGRRAAKPGRSERGAALGARAAAAAAAQGPRQLRVSAQRNSLPRRQRRRRPGDAAGLLRRRCPDLFLKMRKLNNKEVNYFALGDLDSK